MTDASPHLKHSNILLAHLLQHNQTSLAGGAGRTANSETERTETDARRVLQPMDQGPLWTSSWDSGKLQLRSEEHVELAIASSDGAPLVDPKVGEGGEGRVPERPERPEVPVEGSPSAQVVQGYYVGGGVSVWCALDPRRARASPARRS